MILAGDDFRIVIQRHTIGWFACRIFSINELRRPYDSFMRRRMIEEWPHWSQPLSHCHFHRLAVRMVAVSASGTGWKTQEFAQRSAPRAFIRCIQVLDCCFVNNPLDIANMFSPGYHRWPIPLSTRHGRDSGLCRINPPTSLTKHVTHESGWWRWYSTGTWYCHVSYDGNLTVPCDVINRGYPQSISNCVAVDHGVREESGGESSMIRSGHGSTVVMNFR
jgi:hypothetical protein